MNKLISFFAILSLLSLTAADRQAYEVLDFPRDDVDGEFGFYNESDDYGSPEEAVHESQGIVLDNFEDLTTVDYNTDAEHVNSHEEEQVVWADEPVVVVQEENVPTVELTPREEQSIIDVQLSQDGEVIVDNTEIDVVLADDAEEEEDFQDDSAESDDGNDGEILLLPEDNEEQGYTSMIPNTEGKADDVEEEGSLEDTDDGNDGEILILSVENEEEALISMIENMIENIDAKADDEEEEYIDKEQDDVVDDGEIPLLDDGNGDIESDVVVVVVEENEEDETGMIANTDGKADDEEEEEGFVKTELSDDVDDSEVPILYLENEENDGEATSVIANLGDPADDANEEEYKFEENDVPKVVAIETVAVKEKGFLP